MDLIAGHIYTTKDMMIFFNVSKDTWKKKKEKLLLHFGNFYEYEVEYDSKDHRKINYKIIRQLGKYEPPQKKSIIRDKTYENEIVKVIEEDNIQTAKNVSRIIKDTDEIKVFNHTAGTVYTNISLLNQSGFEIVGIAEKGNYKYHHPSRLFNTSELKFLVDSIASSKFLTEKNQKN